MASNKLCMIEGCDKPAHGGGLCTAHRSRQRRHGHPLGGGLTKGFAKSRLSELIASSTDECLNWPYSRLPSGYGKVGRKLVHRVVCEATHGAPPSPVHHAAHRCGNTSCGNPRHIYWATPAQNQADRVGHGTSNRGVRQWRAKLTECAVREIRALAAAGISQAEIGRRIGVSRLVVTKVVNRHTWGWVT